MHLQTHVFGPADAPSVLAIHGLTGHGRRWESLAAAHLADVRVVAPDLIGHGHSPHLPPWSYDHHVDALTAVVDEHIPAHARPFVVVGHSFGGAVAVRLAAALGADVVRGLVLLDPAQGLDPAWALQVATDSLTHWDYADADAARAAKRAEGWADVPDALLDKEIAEHLIDLDNGRVGWRVAAAAAATAWSEMARPFVLPPAGVPTTVVVAERVDPAFVSEAFLRACAAERAESVEVVRADCGHMVAYDDPDLTAGLIRAMIGHR
ncbi:alpha/beta fold hydrolase [Gordonia rhizosphera]|uniref:Putative hydrolase n=1 Tax=Gordonia rhizosphera NBRC 16068 TaxID=1108045 RepID=K6W4D6_9ACTN|nr:alpha/beta hydrolase [Gordonia rhizosphera]GAB88581.1 putative hydrolase [Gordonia rhizosphera NBRC 16068]